MALIFTYQIGGINLLKIRCVADMDDFFVKPKSGTKHSGARGRKTED
jgi:hypothetical protein